MKRRANPCWYMGMTQMVPAAAQYGSMPYGSYTMKKKKQKDKKDKSRRKRQIPDYFDPTSSHNDVSSVWNQDENEGLERFLVSFLRATRKLVDIINNFFGEGVPASVFS